MTDTGSGKVEQGNALQIFHVNFNCSDLDRSRAFYESIGFKVVNDFSQTGPHEKQESFAELGLATILNLPADCDARALLMALADHPRTTRLDLIEWIRPRSERPVRGNLARIGFGRLCLKVKDCHALHARLVQAGRTIYSPPVLLELGGSRQWVFCCEDPDGIVIEFMQFVAA
jgi:catechol 2,3-dioxygenase-like lactoylglutathione lyase family enzyme